MPTSPDPLSPDPVRHAARQERRREYLGTPSECERCGEDHPTALERWRGVTLCYECAREAEGGRSVERHHPLGRALDPALVVPVLGNVHRLLDEAKGDWGPVLARLVGHRPLRRVIALLMSQADWCEQMGPAFREAANYLLDLHLNGPAEDDEHPFLTPTEESSR